MDDNMEHKVADGERALEGTRKIRKAIDAAAKLANGADECGVVAVAVQIATRFEQDQANALEALRRGADPVQAARDNVSALRRRHNIATHALYEGATTDDEAEAKMRELGVAQLLHAGAERALERAEQTASTAIGTLTSNRLRGLWADAGRQAGSLSSAFYNHATVDDFVRAGEKLREDRDRPGFIVARMLVETMAEITDEKDRREFRQCISELASASIPREMVKHVHLGSRALRDGSPEQQEARGHEIRAREAETARRARSARSAP